MKYSSSSRHDPLMQLLNRIGLMALDLGLDEEASRIFASQRWVLADPSALDISRALVLLKLGQPLAAVEILAQHVLADDPTHGVANAVLGFALQQANLPGWRACFDRALAASLDSPPRHAALTGSAKA